MSDRIRDYDSPPELRPGDREPGERPDDVIRVRRMRAPVPIVTSLLVLVAAFLVTRYACVVDGGQASVSLEDLAAASNALQRVSEAEALLRKGRYAEAEHAYIKILDRLPPVEQAVTAAALLRLKHAGEYRRILAAIHGNIGLCQFRARRYRAAEETLGVAVAIDPSNPRSRRNLAMVLFHLKRFAEARDELTRLYGMGIRDAKLYLDLGRSHLGVGEHARARWALMQSLRLARAGSSLQDWGSTLEAEKHLAEAYLMEGNSARAEDLLRSVLSRAPGEVQARYRLFQLLAQQGRSEEAEVQRRRFDHDSQVMAAIQTALSEKPGDVASLQWIADSYRRLGLLHFAEVHYRQLFTRDGANIKAHQAIVMMRRRIHDRRQDEIVLTAPAVTPVKETRADDQSATNLH